jgi:lipoprotein-anchoring transpeptidase ErfK/SrfK
LRTWSGRIAGAIAAIAVLGVAAPASAAPAPAEAEITGLKKGALIVGERATVRAFVGPYVKGEKVKLLFIHDGDVVERVTKRLKLANNGKRVGKVEYASPRLIEPGRYRIRVVHAPTKKLGKAGATSATVRVFYPDLDPGDSGPEVAVFNDLLAERAYYTDAGASYTARTERAVLAFRKVNGMERITDATPTIFRKLAAGKGGFGVRNAGLGGASGRHVEVDISRQVMVLIENGRPAHIFHVSTGAPATPSDQGVFTFYRKDPGYNSIGMYYSVYYNRGEATHGYHSVPTYNASHGCIRNPIPDSVFIYNWINLGDKMYVYA